MKILILSASPRRDKYIDMLFQQKLISAGHEVWVRPCLREGRAAVLEIRPDIVILPPIRNPYSRDFAETCKRMNLGVVTRHTEPSCDEADWRRMDKNQQADICGRFPYGVDAELVWGSFEASMLNKRGVPYKTYAPGAFVADIYKSECIRNQLMPKGMFYQKFGFDKKKKTILISSPWGFLDSCPDLRTDHVVDTDSDTLGRDKYIRMIKELQDGIGDNRNLLLTLHPGVDCEYYKNALPDIKIDTETPAMDLLVNSDCLIHGGSTMAIEMHILNKPAYQFSDVNGCGWWQDGEAVISKVSPRVHGVEELLKATKQIHSKSNANKDTLKLLEAGRYGIMDGHSIDRSIQVINNVSGSFKMYWPPSRFNYDQIFIRKRDDMMMPAICSICKDSFFVITPAFARTLMKHTGKSYKDLVGNTVCPHCGARFFMEERIK